MPSTNLTLSDNRTLAEYVPLAGFEKLLQNRLGVSPDHAALLIRDGRIVDAFVGAHFAIGGVWQRLKEAVGGTHAIRLLLADLKPFQVEGEVEGVSKDGVKIAATVAIDFQVNPESPANIMGMVPESGPLTKADVYARALPHLRERVFRTILAQVDAAAIRGNTALQDKVQADVLQEVQRLFKDLGVLVRAVSVTWAQNDAERDAMQRAATAREQEMLDYRFEVKKREIERERESTEFQFQADVDLETVKAAGEDQLKHMVLQQELRFADARALGVREQELKKLDHELRVLGIQRHDGYQKALEDAQNEVEKTEIQLKLTTVTLEIDAAKELHRLRLEKLREDQKLAIAAAARKEQMDSLAAINNIDLDAKERGTRIDREDRLATEEMKLKAAQQAAANELEKLKLQTQMTPDQILAISAGLSPEVAKVFAERAKLMSIDIDKREALLREMVALTGQGRVASEEQAKFFFDKAMQGLGNARPAAPAPTVPPEPIDVECPGCHKRPPRADRFCKYCGHPLGV